MSFLILFSPVITSLRRKCRIDDIALKGIRCRLTAYATKTAIKREHRQLMERLSEDSDRVCPLILCAKCGSRMCLFATEPERRGRGLFIFECSACGEVEVRTVNIH